MKMRKLFALLLSLVLLFSLAGCGAESMSMNGTASDSFEGSSTYRGEVGVELEDTTVQESPQLPANRKLIQKVWLNAETEDMDQTLAQVNSRISELDGYVEAQNIYNGSAYGGTRYRTAELTVRIPAEQLDSFINKITELSNIVSSEKDTDDITLDYISTESRIKALETEQQRLLELLEMAETMDDLLMIEARLTEVRAELEQVNSTLRLFDNQVNYATVYLSVREVREYTVVTEPETVWQRMGAGFMESLEDIWDGIVEFFVGIVINAPYLILLAALVLVILLLVKFFKKKRKQKRTYIPPQPRQNSPDNQNNL
ncbi:MAG: DUF4349 domain-containing protein [Oscillospiraceae bacterium]|nr:DUF4349 domain-containing protein [Oscillospiraceae bacterium]